MGNKLIIKIIILWQMNVNMFKAVQHWWGGKNLMAFELKKEKQGGWWNGRLRRRRQITERKGIRRNNMIQPLPVSFLFHQNKNQAILQHVLSRKEGDLLLCHVRGKMERDIWMNERKSQPAQRGDASQSRDAQRKVRGKWDPNWIHGTLCSLSYSIFGKRDPMTRSGY